MTPQARLTFCLSLALFLPAFGFANLEREVNTYREAGDLDKAIELVEEALAQVQTTSVQSQLLYNLGTLYLIAGHPEQALTYLFQVQSPSAVVNARVKWNSALARYVMATNFIDRLLKQQQATFNDYFTALVLLREARYEGKLAQFADCERQKLAGESGCVPSQFLARFDQTCENALMQVGMTLSHYLLFEAGAQEVIPWLQFSLQDALYELDFLSLHSLTPELKNSYGELFLNEQASWMPLWEALILRLVEKEQREFVKAFDSYEKGMQTLRAGKPTDSLQWFTKAKNQLEAAYARITQSHPLQAPLTQLLFSYRLALSVYPIQALELKKLQAEQNQLLALFPQQAHVDLQKLLKQSQEALNLGQERLSRFYLQTASFGLRMMIYPMQTHTPKEYLQLVVEAQEQAVFFTSTMQSQDTYFLQLVKSHQSFVERALNLFWESVAEAQQKGFKHACQFQPWNTLIPLIERGRRLSRQAETMLMQPSFSHTMILRIQQEVLKQWREALAQWDVIPKEKDCGSGGGGFKKEQTDTSSQEGPKEIPQLSTTNLLRLLQELEQDDRRPIEPNSSVSEEGVKPW